jgi:diadenosine tetraphosphatase ApaH/serine/threonine PP2A family protein phosphatase
MLIGIITDLHSNLEATLAVLRALDERGLDNIYCLGDIAGYNANPNEVVELIRSRGIPRIMGNHDAVVSGLEKPTFYSSMAVAALAWQEKVVSAENREWLSQSPEQLRIGEKCLGVHGAPSDRDVYIVDWLDAMNEFTLLNNAGVEVCFFGHTHRASFFRDQGHVSIPTTNSECRLAAGNRYLINPGAVGQPRDGDPRAAYGIMNTDNLVFEFHRVEYDIPTAAQKILDVGLPKQLAQRLFRGK